jgi:hypothetical protein
MRWPERRLVFDDGAQADSEEFGVAVATSEAS